MRPPLFVFQPYEASPVCVHVCTIPIMPLLELGQYHSIWPFSRHKSTNPLAISAPGLGPRLPLEHQRCPEPQPNPLTTTLKLGFILPIGHSCAGTQPTTNPLGINDAPGRIPASCTIHSTAPLASLRFYHSISTSLFLGPSANSITTTIQSIC